MGETVFGNKAESGSGILEQAKDAHLDFGAALQASPEEIDRFYNGTGPDRWPKEIRDRIDGYTKFYAPAVVIHDCDFAKSDGSENGLVMATERFRSNTKRLLKHYYPLWCVRWLKDSEYRRTRSRLVALKVAMDIGVSEKFCRQAWKEAFEKYTKES